MTTTTPTPYTELPELENVGQFGRWDVPTTDRNDRSVQRSVLFTGRFLGIGSSRQPHHRNHGDGLHQPPTGRCGACRWYETRLFAVDLTDDSDVGQAYVVHHTGATEVLGEVDLYRIDNVASPYQVLEICTVRRRTASGSHEAYLTRPGAYALSQAAAFDDGIRVAYENRAIS